MQFDITKLDRRIVYLLILIALTLPLLLKLSFDPVPMASAKKFFETIEGLERDSGKIVLLVLDFGPNSKAENFPQSEVLIEHLLRRHIPFAIMSQYIQSEPLLESIPAGVLARLAKENTEQHWEYGKDWINLGYRVGGALFIQSLARADSLTTSLKKDARGNDLNQLPIFSKVKSIESIQLLAQLSSLVGTLDTLLSFFQTDNYKPPMVHGCTSITIPQAYIFLDSGQLRGLLEGIAGAASYSVLLDLAFPGRLKDRSRLLMTGIGVAHLVVIGLVLLGNLAPLIFRKQVTA